MVGAFGRFGRKNGRLQWRVPELHYVAMRLRYSPIWLSGNDEIHPAGSETELNGAGVEQDTIAWNDGTRERGEVDGFASLASSAVGDLLDARPLRCYLLDGRLKARLQKSLRIRCFKLWREMSSSVS